MDPFAPTAGEWNEIARSITFLTLALISAFLTGPVFLVAHAIIPSAVDSKTISNKFNKLRPMLYFSIFILYWKEFIRVFGNNLKIIGDKKLLEI